MPLVFSSFQKYVFSSDLSLLETIEAHSIIDCELISHASTMLRPGKSNCWGIQSHGERCCLLSAEQHEKEPMMLQTNYPLRVKRVADAETHSEKICFMNSEWVCNYTF
jgi:hypothetical protein